MPPKLAPDVEQALEKIRRTLLKVKADVFATGPVYLLAQAMGLALDLLEHLLQREHERLQRDHAVSAPKRESP